MRLEKIVKFVSKTQRDFKGKEIKKVEITEEEIIIIFSDNQKYYKKWE